MRRYLSALKRYKWLIIGIVLLGTTGGFLASRFIDPKYEVSAAVVVAESPDPKGPIQARPALDQSAWVELIRSFAIIDPVARELRLYITPRNDADSVIFRGFNPAPTMRTGSYSLKLDQPRRRYALAHRVGRTEREVERGAIGDSIGRTVGFMWAPPAALLAGRDDIDFQVLSVREAARSVRDRLVPSKRDRSNLLNVTLTGERAQELARTLNLVLDRFIAAAAELKKLELSAFASTLEEQLDVAKRHLSTGEGALESFKAGTIAQPSEKVAIVPGVGPTTSPAISSYFTQRVEFDNVRRDREAVERIQAETRSAGRVTPEALLSVPTILQTSPDLKKTLDELSTKKGQLRALRMSYTDEHRLVKEAMSQIDQLETQTIPAMVGSAYQQLQGQERELNRRLSGAADEIRRIPARTIEEQRLTREVEVADALYKNLKSRYEEAKLAEQSAIPDVSVLDTAVAPLRPTSDTASRLLLMAIGAAFAAAIALALLLDLLDKRFRYPEQATKELGLEILAGVPKIRRLRNGEMPIDEASQLVEAFRGLRLSVRNAVDGDGPVMLTVSSPGPGDGKSLISSNLALSFAESGYRTLLVDGDIRRGQLHAMFGVPQKPGLVDVLTGDVSSDSAIRETEHANLFVLACGTRRHRGPELLAADGAAKLLRALRSKFDAVIVDTAPLGAGIDPFALGAATGNILIVLRTGRTDRKLAQAKLTTLDRLPVRIIGAVLNDIVQEDGMYKYYAYLDGYSMLEDEPSGQLVQSGGRAAISERT